MWQGHRNLVHFCKVIACEIETLGTAVSPGVFFLFWQPENRKLTEYIYMKTRQEYAKLKSFGVFGFKKNKKNKKKKKKPIIKGNDKVRY